MQTLCTIKNFKKSDKMNKITDLNKINSQKRIQLLQETTKNLGSKMELNVKSQWYRTNNENVLTLYPKALIKKKTNKCK